MQAYTFNISPFIYSSLNSVILPRRKPIAHFPIGRSPVHINYRLHGSIPVAERNRIFQERTAAVREVKATLSDLPDPLYEASLAMEMDRINQQFESAVEQALHCARTGPMHLQQPEIRETVIDSWKYLHARKEIELHAVCAMSNHVHLIVSSTSAEESLDIGWLMNRHKTYTGKRCNQLLSRTGQAFWAPKYFDRTIRDGKFLIAMWYVLNNPVKAGLVGEWREWPGTFVNPEYLSHFI
ncbi:transposase [Lewinella sp. JB7]|uniref:transposase n=1 Tax=Lewinella sp. JB7 TaxID=2962887 RepID=UPI0020CA0AF8|nr:transposase [Lewinella sp. JB7]MCP9234703.1 transposase [Lewinella sp. JB7]